MRRALSVVLFIIGGLALTCEVMIVSINVGEPAPTALAMIGIMLGLSIPFLLLASWASPGNGLADLGITMVIAAGVGAGCTLITFMLLSDPRFLMLLPLESPARKLHFDLLPGAANLVVIAGLGSLLWSSGRKRHKRRAALRAGPLGNE